MASLFARFGQLESRAALALGSGKRKRHGSWTCTGCNAKAQSALSQQRRRQYGGDASLRLGETPFGFASEGRAEEAQGPTRTVGWGLGGWASSEPDRKTYVPPAQTSNVESEGFQSARDQEWDQVEPAEDAAAIDPTRYDLAVAQKVLRAAARDRAEAGSAAHAQLLDLDYRTELPTALLYHDQDLIARCLFAARQARNTEFIRSIPSTTFSEIIHAMQAQRVVGDLSSIHLGVSPATAEKLGVAPMDKVASEYSWVLFELAHLRRAAGQKLAANDYLGLLRSARDLGNKRMAAILWSQLAEDDVKPTTPMYNAYMASCVWAGCMNAHARYRDRVVPFHMEARKAERTGVHFSNYRVGPSGVREKAMSMFSAMLKNGAAADEESFRIVIAAAAREGEMGTVKSILRKIWSVDVDALMGGKTDETTELEIMARNDPLYPSPDLLRTIAYAFGINNDIPAAFRVVDFVARKYDLEIPMEAWSALFDWTFVLAFPRQGTAARGGLKTGQLPKQSVERLWKTFTRAPYFVQPDMGMYNKLIKSLAWLHDPTTMLRRMKEGLRMQADVQARQRQMWEVFQQAVESVERGEKSETPISRLRRDVDNVEVEFARNDVWLKRWVRLMCRMAEFTPRTDYDEAFALRRFPRMIWHWRDFAPNAVAVETPTGLIEFEIRNSEEILASAKVREEKAREVESWLERATVFIGNDWRCRPVMSTKRSTFEEEVSSERRGP